MPDHNALATSLDKIIRALPSKARGALALDIASVEAALRNIGPGFWKDPEKAEAAKLKMRAAAHKRWSDPATRQAHRESRSPQLLITWRSTNNQVLVTTWAEAARIMHMKKPQTLSVYVSSGNGVYSRTVDDDVITIERMKPRP